MQKKKAKIFFRLLVVLLLLFSIIGMAGCGSSEGVGENNVGVKVSGKRFEAREPDGVGKVSKNYGAKTDSGGKSQYQPAGFVGFGFFLQTGSTFHRQEKSSDQIAPFRFLGATMYHSLFADMPSKYLVNDIGCTGSHEVRLYSGEKPGDMNLDPYRVCKELSTQTFNILKGSGSWNAKAVFSNVLNSLKSVVAAILVIFWAVQFMQQVLQERFTMESFLKGMCQLAIGMLIVCNAQNICGAFINGANDVVNKLTRVTSTSAERLAFQQFCWTTSNNSVLYACFFASGFGDAWFASPIFWVDFGSLLGVVVMLLPFIGQLICAYQIVTQMVTRMLELVVRVAVAPLPLAFGAAQGFGPSSLSFLKGTFATAMQPVLIMIGAMSFDAILTLMNTVFKTSSAMGSLLGALVMFLAYMVLSGFIGQTRQLSQEIIAR